MEEKFDYHVPQTATTSSASLQTLKVAKFVTLFGKEPYNVTTNDCEAFEGRARFVGNYNKYECAVELDNVTPEGKNI